MKIGTILMLAFVSIPVSALAGPLGAKMGMEPSDIPGIISSDTVGFYTSNSAPSPSSLFDRYSYKFGKDGLCEIQARGKIDFRNESAGGLSSQTDDIVRALENKYGEKDSIAQFEAISASKFEYDFMSIVRGNDRANWIDWKSKGTQRLPDSLLAISLYTYGSNLVEGGIVLAYQFNNYPSCFGNDKTSNL